MQFDKGKATKICNDDNNIHQPTNISKQILEFHVLSLDRFFILT